MSLKQNKNTPPNKHQQIKMESIDFSRLSPEEVMKYFEEKNNFKYINLLKTRDAKKLHKQLINIFLKHFRTDYAKKKFYWFMPTLDDEELKRRQEFIEECLNVKELNIDNISLELPNASIYDVAYLTTDYEEYKRLIQRYKGFPIFWIASRDDIAIAKDYYQVRTNDESIAELPNAILTDVPFPDYEIKRLIAIKSELERLKPYLSQETQALIDELVEYPMEDVNNFIENKINEINDCIANELKNQSFNGYEVLELLKNKKSEKLQSVIAEKIERLNNELREKFNVNVMLQQYIELEYPLQIQENALNEIVRLIKQEQLAKEFHHYYEIYKKVGNADDFIKRINIEIGEYDFKSGIKEIITIYNLKPITFIERGFEIKNGRNIFLIEKGIDVEPVDYDVDSNVLLTGANSGGKTTLLQLIFQVFVLGLSGFYVPANAKIQKVESIYYFSKPTGKTDAGAFETLLKTFNKIKKNENKLILADEIEAITEPGAAARILEAIVEWFKENSIVIIVTHLGEELKKLTNVRIDGIQALGIENGKLIVNRSPIKGIVAKSTPELIVEKLKESSEFFKFIYKKLKNN